MGRDTRWRDKDKGSELRIESHGADAFEVKAGKILRVTTSYPDVATAVEAIGLAGQAMSRLTTTKET